MVLEDAVSNCEASSFCGASGLVDEESECASAPLAPALVQLISLSLQRGEQKCISVSSRGPSTPTVWGGGASGSSSAAAPKRPCHSSGDEQQPPKRRSPPAADAPAPRAADCNGEPNQLYHMDCSRSSSDEVHGTARAARRAMVPLRLDLSAPEAHPSTSGDAGGGPAPITPAQWMDRMETQLGSHGRSRSASAGAADADADAPATRRAAAAAPTPLVPPAFVCLGLMGAGGGAGGGGH